MLRNVKVKAYIDEQLDKLHSERSATANEVKEAASHWNLRSSHPEPQLLSDRTREEPRESEEVKQYDK